MIDCRVDCTARVDVKYRKDQQPDRLKRAERPMDRDLILVSD